ncbi:MAG: DUF1841 family protein [Mariprofundales bacterium]|nr:DUF1841 family protein [Mariprofundales bacterium]
MVWVGEVSKIVESLLTENASPSREQLRAHRKVLWLAWSRAQHGLALNALEQRIVAVIALHPEYHAMFRDKEAFLDRDQHPDDGLNPYLHLSLHLALEEQLATSQPPAIVVALHHLMQVKGMERHQALHKLLELLAETVHQAQHNGGEPDVLAYQHRLEEITRA